MSEGERKPVDRLELELIGCWDVRKLIERLRFGDLDGRRHEQLAYQALACAAVAAIRALQEGPEAIAARALRDVDFQIYATDSDSIDVRELGLSGRVVNALWRAGFTNTRRIALAASEEVLAVRGLGRKGFGELIYRMRKRGCRINPKLVEAWS